MKLSRSRRVYCLSVLTDFAYMLFIFVITRRLAESGANPFQLGILGTASSLSYALGCTVAGRLSDRLGRRRLILLGAALQITGFLLASHWQSRLVTYLLTAVVGANAGLIYPPAIAWLTEGAHHSQQTTGTIRKLLFFCIAWNLGIIIGQMSGGWLFSLSRGLPMEVSAAAMVLVVILVWRPAPEPDDELERQAPPARHVTPERARAFVYLAWTSNVASALSVSMIIYLFPYLAEKLAISPPTHGMMLASQRAVVIIMFLLMWRFTFWQYRLATALIVQGVGIAGLLLLTTGTTVLVLTAGVMLVGVLGGYNYFASIFYSTTGFADDQKVTASGMHETTLAVGFGAGAVLGGLVGTYLGGRASYLFCALAIVISSVIQIAMFASWRRRWAMAKPRRSNH